MERPICAAAACLAAAFFLLPAGSQAGDLRSAPPKLEGLYVADGDTTKAVTITHLVGDAYRVSGPQWEGVGFFDGKRYWGIFRSQRGAGSPESTAVRGTHQGTLRPDGSFAVHGVYASGRSGPFEAVWALGRNAAPAGRPGPPAARFKSPALVVVTPPENDRLPALGEYVYVEELPEAVTKVKPDYPKAARDAKIEGTVMIQALVGEDGRVKDIKVVHSVPGLDEAAAAAVRQWVFRPAQAKGTPVAVWVATPVRFSLH